ncbi:MAG: Amuc_1100 family pilus-like protein [Chthoniobacter sp.]|uniref:Amuc_1100 family pilus-like protein n=1 Tax=Chthoniobacter sp. TaxID=2510640 RepID=UPI0032A6E317
MNWVKQNKFLTGFIVVMLIGVGALGFELFTASSAYDEATENYTKASAEYNRLRHLVPYPNRQNLTAYEEQKQEAASVINAFESDLSKKEFPLESFSPEGFQDKLKASVTAVRAKATENGIKLPDKFYLAFEKYETTPPAPEAAAPLGRELKAIEWVVNQYLSHSSNAVEGVVSLVRADLPQEKGGKGGKGGGGSGPGAGGGPGNNGPGGKGGPGGGGGSGRRDLVKYHPFDIAVSCKPAALREVLNTITGPQAPQFYVVRQLRIHSSKEKGPARAGDAADNDKDKQTIHYILGEEWMEVTARIEIVDFTPPGEKPASDKSSAAPKSAPRP